MRFFLGASGAGRRSFRRANAGPAGADQRGRRARAVALDRTARGGSLRRGDRPAVRS